MIARSLSVGLSLGLPLFLASCASATRDLARNDSGKRVLSPAQYEQVYVTGSNIPVLVPKGDSTVQALPPISPVNTISAEAWRNAMSNARSGGRRR